MPHKGWSCVGVADLGEPDAAICAMCKSQSIRYAHTMQHPDYMGTLDIGCVCAERMEDDYLGPRKRENALRSAAGRRRKWLSRTWRTSVKGNSYLNTDGLNITIFQQGDGSWSGRIEGPRHRGRRQRAEEIRQRRCRQARGVRRHGFPESPRLGSGRQPKRSGHVGAKYGRRGRDRIGPTLRDAFRGLAYQRELALARVDTCQDLIVRCGNDLVRLA